MAHPYPLPPAGLPNVPTYRVATEYLRKALADCGVTKPEGWQCPCCDNSAFFGMAMKDGKPVLFMVFSMTFFAEGQTFVTGMDSIRDIDNLPDEYPTIDRSILATWYTAGLGIALRACFDRGVLAS